MCDTSNNIDVSYLVSDHPRGKRRCPGGAKIPLPVLLSRVPLVVDRDDSSRVNQQLEGYGSVTVGLLDSGGHINSSSQHGALMI